MYIKFRWKGRDHLENPVAVRKIILKRNLVDRM
jgi:hypothetical protein